MDFIGKQKKIVLPNGDLEKYRDISVKRKNLPAKYPTDITWLKQSNMLTLMRCDYNMLHYRVMIAVVEKVQKAIDESINGIQFEQLSLFREFDSANKILLSIQYRDLGVTPDCYNQVKSVLKELASIPVEFDTIDPLTGADVWAVSGLFKAYIPKVRYAKYFTIEMEREIANVFMNMTQGFTKYGKEIAIKTKSKYTIRLYFLISSWKKKGGFSITISKFRKLLSIENKYQNYKDLYKRVIYPAYSELHESADIWFEFSEVYKEEKKEPYKLNFKIMKRNLSLKDKEFLDIHRNNFIRMATTHLNFKEKHLNKVLDYIDINNVLASEHKVIFLVEYVRKNWRKITNIPDYCVKSILEEIAPLIEEND